MFLSLHTADPSGGDQTTNECAFGGYRRVAYDRERSEYVFDESTSGDEVVTYAAIGTDEIGPGRIVHVVGLFPTMTIKPGITARIKHLVVVD